MTRAIIDSVNKFSDGKGRYRIRILRDPKSIPWRFKNGRQKTFIRDLDHGTIREWGSPGHQVVHC